MATFAASASAIDDALLPVFGEGFSVVKVTRGAYTPATGAVSATGGTPVAVTGYWAALPVEQIALSGGLLRLGDMSAMIRTADVVVAVGDRVTHTATGVVYQVVAVDNETHGAPSYMQHLVLRTA